MTIYTKPIWSWIRFKWDWSSIEKYIDWDLVKYTDWKLYICITKNKNKLPTDTEYWSDWFTGDTWKWIDSVTSNKVGKTTTVTITWDFDNSPYSFNIEDWEVSSVNWQTWIVVLNQDDILDGTTARQFTITNKNDLNRGLSTAVLTYPTVTINADPTKINIPSFIWRKVDAYTDPTNPVVNYYTFPWVTGLSITNIATQDVTYLSVDSTWTVHQTSSNDSWTNSRDRVTIWSVVHTNRTSVERVDKFVNVVWYDLANNLWDISNEIGIINSWNKFSANWANLKINKSIWTSTQVWLNIWNSIKSPNIVSDPALTATPFLYSWRDWAGWFTVLPATWDNIVPWKYDNNTWWTSTPNGSVPSAKWTIQKIWYVSSLQLVAIEYWQALYNNQAEAEAARSYDTIENPALSWASFRWWLFVRWDASNLSNSPTQAVFLDAWKFWSRTGWVWSGSSTTTLQQAFDNSTLPQIVWDSLELQQKTSNSNNTQVWKNLLWAIVATIRWDWIPTATTDLTTKSYVDTWLTTKQATLVSWTNIKTVNWNSLLWSWDLVISGWGSNPIFTTNIDWQTYTWIVARFVAKGTQTIAWVKISLASLPTWSNFSVDVRKNWTATTNSIFTSDTPISITTAQGITNGIYITTWTAIDNGSLVENDVLYVVITAVWNVLPGSDLEVVIY